MLSTRDLEKLIPAHVIQNSSLPIPDRTREECANVKFYKKSDYTKFLDNFSSSTGVVSKKDAGSARYLESIEGELLDSERVDAIRAYSRANWVSLADRDLAPEKWSSASREARDYFHYHMASRFPELAYSANCWKIEQIATDGYPSWLKGQRKRGTIQDLKPKQEEIDQDVRLVAERSKKRKPDDVESSKGKRAKTSEAAVMERADKGKGKEVQITIPHDDLCVPVSFKSFLYLTLL